MFKLIKYQFGRKIVVVITRRSNKRGGRKAGFHCLSNAGYKKYLYNTGRTIKTLWGNWRNIMQEKVIDQAFVIFFFRGRATGKGKKRRRHTVPHDLRLKRSCSLKIPPSPLLLIVGKRPKILGQFTNKTAKTSYRVKSKTDSTAMRLYQYNLY